jgi:hypothetical protein
MNGHVRLYYIQGLSRQLSNVKCCIFGSGKLEELVKQTAPNSIIITHVYDLTIPCIYVLPLGSMILGIYLMYQSQLAQLLYHSWYRQTTEDPEN